MKCIPLATASVIYHKFFRENSLQLYDPYVSKVNHSTCCKSVSQSPLLLELNYNAQSPLVLELNHNAQSPLVLELNHNAQSPLVLELNHNAQSPLMLE